MRMITKYSGTGSTQQIGTKSQSQGKSEPIGWREAGAMLGLAGGLLCNLLGLILTAIAWFMTAPGIGPTVHTVGTVLLIANIPLLMGGAHCLDLVEKRKRFAVLAKELVVHRADPMEKGKKFK